MQKKYEYMAVAKVKATLDMIPPEMMDYWEQGYELLYRNGYIYAIPLNEINRKV